ncbi:MAG: hypothetical protein ACC742_00115 [Thermoanaerobaculales bacterium]
MIGLLFAAAIVLYLSSRDATSSLDAVAAVAVDLREENVEGRSLDRAAARTMVSALQTLLDEPETIADHLDSLKAFSATAASWAQAAESPSPELHAAVSLRSAAGELRQHALSPSPVHLTRARHSLEQARNALAVEAPAPGLATDAVRDRLENLQRSQQERYQEVAEEINQ